MKKPDEYKNFAAAYMDRWTDPHTQWVLKKMCDYEDDVKLDFKPLLRHLQDVTRLQESGKDIILLGFVGVDSTLNSDCLGAVEDYLRVFLYEHGHAGSYAASMDLLGDCTTDFPGLAYAGVQPGANAQANSLNYKMVMLSFDTPEAGTLLEESLKALHALASELSVKGGAAMVNDPQVHPAAQKKSQK